MSDILKGGVGSGIKGHKTDKKDYVKDIPNLTDEEIKSDFNIILENNKELKDDLKFWYGGSGIKTFRNKLSDIFNIQKSNLKISNKYKEDTIKIYKLSQEYIDRNEFENITIFRGVGTDGNAELQDKQVGDKFEVNDYTISSWTFNPSMATIYSKKGNGIVLKTEIDKKRIFMHPDLGGSMYSREQEVIVLGSKINVSVTKINKG